MNIGFDENTAVEEFIIDIRDKNDVIKHRYALNSKDIEKNSLMSEHYIQLEEFLLDSFVKFVRSDYIMWEGEKYIIKEDYIPDQVNKFNYKYTLRFDLWTTFLQDDTFYYTNQNLEEADWSLMSNAVTHFQLIADNANRYFGVNTFNVGTIEFAEMKLLQFSKVSIWNAATQIADAYKAEWYLTGTTFHLVKKFSYGSEVDFESEVSVEKMDRSEGENSEKYSRILAFGSTRNIPANYRETTPSEAVDAIYQKRLRIPQSKGNFIDIKPNLSPEEVKSAVVIFDDIYPKRIGTMSSISTVEYTETDETTGVVTKWNAYRFKDTGLSFKEKYRLPGIELRIVFQSGALNGTDYEVKFNPLGKAETDPESQLFEIIRNEDYGKALPNDILKPQNGDIYILYGFDIKLVSDQYIPAGEEELFDTATEWLVENNRDKSVFECPTMIEYFEDREMDLEIGQKVKLIHGQFESGFRSSRIQGYEKHLLDKYQATYTVGDNATYSWPKDIEESIKELQVAGITYQATGRNGVYLITQFDNTPASDFNAYSAKASDARYLNRISGGTVQGDTTFQKKVKAKEVISDQFGNETFMPGMFGNGFKFWVENGLSFGQLDYLTITREMLISVLTVAEVKSVDGGMIISAANMICNKTEETTSGYKCYFDNDNGNIPNKFVVGDQAICRRFNGANVKYYWRLVLEIGTNHILLSKTDKDGSGIPSAKDNIVQFGNRTNTQRQFAVYTVGYGDAGTYYYYGVNSYDLTGKAKTYFDKTGARIDGESIIFSSSGKSATTVINESKQEAISTAATDATNKVNSIQVGGRNLALDSRGSWSRTSYGLIRTLKLSSPLVIGETYVVTWKNIKTIGRLNSWMDTSGVSQYRQAVINGTPFKANNAYPYLSFYSENAPEIDLEIEKVKVEEGNKNTSWTSAPEDVQANIDAANTVATNAATAASNAQTSANTANSLLTDIASDNKLTPNEKSSVRQEWNVIAAEISVNNAQADIFGITTEKTAYTSAFQALANYLNNGTTWSTGVPSWISDTNLSVTTTIVGSTFRANWKAYYDARTILLNAIAKKSKQLADAAQSSADTANAGLLSKVAYSEYNAQMQIHNNQISSKVSQTDFNSLNQRVGDTESSITQQAGQISSVVTQVNTAQTTADNAATAASNANTSAQNAQTTANSKNRTYYQDAQPTTPSGGFAVGDIWQKVTLTDINGNINSDTTKNVCRLEYRWNGTTWVQINVNISGSYVTQTNDSITSLVTKTGINGLGVGETLKSLIDQTPGQIELAVSAIQVGGRNLALDSRGSWSRTSYGLIRTLKLSSPLVIGETYVVTWKNIKTIGRLNSWMDTSGVSQYRQAVINGTPFKANNAYPYLSFYSENAPEIDLEIEKVKVEEGNKNTSWTSAPEDVQANIDAANTVATNAATAASNAQKSANTANSLLTDIANDNLLIPSEKQSTKKEWDIIVSEYSKNIAQANSFTVSTTVYTSAYNALSSYITPLLSNLNTTSDIVGTTFRSNFKSYYDARTDLLNAVSTKAKDIADSKTDLDTVKAGITINADGVTAFGNQFKVDSLLIANAIQTEELNVGNGNCVIGTDGKISAKGATLEGSLEIGWDGDINKPINRITVVDRSSSTQKTKVLITPQNITSLSSIGGNTTYPPVVSGGASVEKEILATDTYTWTGATIVLPLGKTYDLEIPVISLNASGSTNGLAGYTMSLENITTSSRILLVSQSSYGNHISSNQKFTLSGLPAGSYRLTISLIAVRGGGDFIESSSMFIPANAAYTVRPITDAVEIGANGMCGLFTSERYFHVTTDGFYIRMGNNGFRVTVANGLQKSTNLNVSSPTWTNV